ncbi:hypothetical protein [Absidia glauca]|uniref:Uncharacterized protein n=1 Tax=Absidia glauca TaxID=4829 RepID=A0A168PJ58_ABSGL|nr:hypothetical protein [Absidia glauca]
MRSSAATAFVNSEWPFAVFQPVGKLRQKKLRTVLRLNVFKLERYAQEGRTIMYIPLECKSKSEAHGGDKLMTLLKPLKGWAMACGYSPPWASHYNPVESQF